MSCSENATCTFVFEALDADEKGNSNAFKKKDI
jgi:hypothetical protein